MFNLFKKNWVPKIIPISRMEGYHTHYIGVMKNGNQFFGYTTFAFVENKPIHKDWEEKRKEYSVIYIFDKKGNLINTECKFIGFTNEIKFDKPKIELDNMMLNLGLIKFQDIKVKPFKTTIDNIVFGLIPVNENKSIILEPSNTIAFFEPWDGEYYT